MKKWRNKFYQKDWLTSKYRECEVILEEVGNPKHGLYEARVVEITPKTEYRYGSVGGGIWHPYKIGELFKLRQHKSHWFFKEPLWQDVRYPGRNGYEDFWEIKEV